MGKKCKCCCRGPRGPTGPEGPVSPQQGCEMTVREEAIWFCNAWAGVTGAGNIKFERYSYLPKLVYFSLEGIILSGGGSSEGFIRTAVPDGGPCPFNTCQDKIVVSIPIINGGTSTDPIYEIGKLTITSNFLTIEPLNGLFQPSTTHFGFETFNGHYFLDCE